MGEDEERRTVAPARASGGAQEFAGQILGLLGNVTALTALLVYFGWRRAETQAQQLGFDESLLGMTTQDYVLRSLGPVLPLLLTVAVAGLVWLWADPRIAASIARGGRLARYLPPLAALLAILLPFTVYLTAPAWEETAYVMWPLAIGAGILLLIYAEVLRRRLGGGAAGHPLLAKAFAFLAVAVCLFWAASNQAEVLGSQLAENFSGQLDRTVRVTVYSGERLYLQADAVGVIEEELDPVDGAYRYRYRGLRLLDHIGNRYFLISDGWTPQQSVVIALTDGETLRFEFRR